MEILILIILIDIIIKGNSMNAMVLDKNVRDENEFWEWIPLRNGDLRRTRITEALKKRYIHESKILKESLSVTYNLFTTLNRNAEDGQLLEIGNDPLLIESNFNPFYPTRIIVHGWLNNADSKINHLIRDALLKRNNFNVIVMDWSTEASNYNYFSARYSVEDVGSILAEFIEYLLRYSGMKLDSLTLIGHSLGAHVVGMAGKFLKRKGRELPSIIGLDPAQPLFSYSKPEERLSSTDAKYVEAIQTSAGVLGFRQPIGITTFYPNWGNLQPGCGLDISRNCSHGRAHEFYAETLDRFNQFWGVKCDNYKNLLEKKCIKEKLENVSNVKVLMGGEPSNMSKPEGVFFLPTNSMSPFAIGDILNSIKDTIYYN